MNRHDADSAINHESPAAYSDPIIVEEYAGSFPLCWLWPGERVGSAGDGTGACIIYRADGSEHRVNKGDLIEVAAEYEDDDLASREARSAAIPRIGERLALTEVKLGRLLMRLELLSKIEGPDARPGPSELGLTREIIELVRDA